MKFSCSECGQRIETKETWVGRTIDCPNPNCDHRFTIQAPLPQDGLPAQASTPVPPPEPPRPAPSPVDQPAGPLPPVPEPTPPGAGEPIFGGQPMPGETRARFPAGTAVLTALILVVTGYPAVLACLNESPQQFWRRLTGASTVSAAPAPAEPPVPAPAVATTPPPPEPGVAAAHASPPPSAATPVPPDALAWLRAHTGSWPKNLTLLKAADFQVISGGRVAGSARMPAGTVVTLAGFRDDGTVEVSCLGSTARLPAGDLDLRAHAQKAMAEAAIAAERQSPTEKAPPSSDAPDTTPAVALAPGALPALPGLPMENTRQDAAPPAAQSPPLSRVGVDNDAGSPGAGGGETEPPGPEPTPARAGAASYFGAAGGGGDPEPPRREFPATGLLKTIDRDDEKADTLPGRRIVLKGTGALRLTGAGDPLPGSAVNFTSPDAWLFLENMRPSVVASTIMDRLWVNGSPARLGANIRVAVHGSDTVVIPQGPDFAAMQVFQGADLAGEPAPLRAGVKYDDASLGAMKTNIGSFRLKRGYTATVAQEENGTGISKNYVAQDRDLEVRSLPAELDKQIRFVRIFPWRWTSKKGVAGGIWQNLNVGWFYNWNINENSRPDLEYVPIKQKRGWPGLNQDWVGRGATTLLGYNEPDHKDQANLTVEDAIAGWPELLSTGLRLGSPAVSDGGLGWLFDFMQKADAAKLRVDFVAVHYYRAVSNPGDAKGAATQFYNYLRGIHDRTHRPIWITEWNNGANWTGHKPDYEQERAAIAEMVRMLEETPFVERYAIYNWVEDTRNVQRKDGSLTPAGEVYRDKVSTIGYTQARP